jgi:hypothetical protein
MCMLILSSLRLSHIFRCRCDGGWYLVQGIHQTGERFLRQAMLPEARPRVVYANRTQKWVASSSHISCDHKMFFVILGKSGIELAPNSRIMAPLSKINTKETHLSERTARFGMIFELMIFTMGSFGYTLLQ